MARKVRTHTFSGVKYNIDVYEPFDALCDSPRSTDNTPNIRVAVDINTKKGLIALFHEILHAENYSTSEDIVERVSTEGGSLLWRLDYRRKK